MTDLIFHIQNGFLSEILFKASTKIKLKYVTTTPKVEAYPGQQIICTLRGI